MTEQKIILHKEIQTDSTYIPSFTLRLTVTSTSGGITPCIFVHEYIPKNPNTGKVSYDFLNVAYYDELTEVRDYVEDKKRSGKVRRSCIIKSFSNQDSLDEFLSIVTHDVQRLLQQLNSIYTTDSCETITITPTSAISSDCDTDYKNDNGSDSTAAEAIVLTFSGELKN